MQLIKWIPITKAMIKMEINKAIQFKVNTLFEILTSFFYLLINLFFWKILFNLGYVLPGWTYNDTIVFIAFSELFFGLQGAIFSSLSRFWTVIISGQLDVMLVRPFDSRIRTAVLNIDYIELIKTMLFFTVLLIYSQKHINLIWLIIAITVCLISLYVFSLIQLTISYLAFFFGKVEAFNELSDSLTVINKYPVTILPKKIFNILRLILPFLFFSTFPSQIANQLLTPNAALFGVIGLMVNLIIWSIINNITWKKGLRRYESYNG